MQSKGINKLFPLMKLITFQKCCINFSKMLSYYLFDILDVPGIYIYVDTAHEKYNKFWSTTNISHGISLSISLIFLKSGCDTPHNIWLLYIIQSTRRTVRQITSYTLSNAIILGQPKLNLFPIPKMTEQFTHRGFLKLKNSATSLWDREGMILPSKTQSNCPNLASFFESKTPLCCN